MVQWCTSSCRVVKRTSVCVIFYHCTSDTLSESRRNWRQCILVKTLLKNISQHNKFSEATRKIKMLAVDTNREQKDSTVQKMVFCLVPVTSFIFITAKVMSRLRLWDFSQCKWSIYHSHIILWAIRFAFPEGKTAKGSCWSFSFCINETLLWCFACVV